MTGVAGLKRRLENLTKKVQEFVRRPAAAVLELVSSKEALTLSARLQACQIY